ncbi:hypothetical protein [Specibacter sp. NPDC078709]
MQKDTVEEPLRVTPRSDETAAISAGTVTITLPHMSWMALALL